MVERKRDGVGTFSAFVYGLVGRYGRSLLAPHITGQVRYTDDIHLPRML